MCSLEQRQGGGGEGGRRLAKTLILELCNRVGRGGTRAAQHPASLQAFLNPRKTL